MKPDEIVKALHQCHEMLCDCGAEAEYVKDAADLIESLQSQLADARNELCQQCGRCREAHKGACNGCRWKKMPQ